MCVIIICCRTKPTLETLEKCEKQNSDGAGISWFVKDKEGKTKVHFKKGLTAPEVYLLSQEHELPQVIHFRIGTSGGKGKYATHPFIIDHLDANNVLEAETDKTLLFHNGVWSNWEEKLFDFYMAHDVKAMSGMVSDSRAIAFLASVTRRGILGIFPGYQKFAIADPSNPKVITYWGKWEDKDDMLFSNLSWDRVVTNYSNTSLPYSDGWDDKTSKKGKDRWSKKGKWIVEDDDTPLIDKTKDIVNKINSENLQRAVDSEEERKIQEIIDQYSQTPTSENDAEDFEEGVYGHYKDKAKGDKKN